MDFEALVQKVNSGLNASRKTNWSLKYSSRFAVKSSFRVSLEASFLLSRMDFEALVQKVNSGLDIDYIDIIHRFKLEDYFKTDIHLKQDSYLKIVDEYIDKFGLDRQHIDYKRHTLNHFYGASFSKAPFSKPEDIEMAFRELDFK